MKRLFLIPALAAAALALTVPARAQSAGWPDADRLGYAQRSYNDAQRAAYDNGYREGVKQGENDGRRNNAFAFQDERTFQRADKGYHREFGDARALPYVVPQRLLRRVFRRLSALRQELRVQRPAGIIRADRGYPTCISTLSAAVARLPRLRQPRVPERRERRVRERRRGRAQEPVVRPAPPLVVSLRRSPLRRTLRITRAVQGRLSARGSQTATTGAIAKGDTAKTAETSSSVPRTMRARRRQRSPPTRCASDRVPSGASTAASAICSTA